MPSVSGYGNYGLCHDPQDQNEYPSQFAHQGLHHEQPKYITRVFSVRFPNYKYASGKG